MSKHGIKDADAEWGNYVFPRPFDQRKFLSSLRAAESTPVSKLKADGNRAVMISTTTDAWQVIRHPDPQEQRRLTQLSRTNVREALELILSQSTLNVRILTRSPLVKQDFDLLERFGNRVLLGSSIPTLRHDLAKIYEPGAPAPLQRLKMLEEAKARGIPVYVAVAPAYPECDGHDLLATLRAIAPLEPTTVFFEPINIRADNAQRIARHAQSLGVKVNSAVFETKEAWAEYAIHQLRAAERAAEDVGLAHCLHLWPDKDLGAQKVVSRQADPAAYLAWLRRSWDRISEWPRATPVKALAPTIVSEVVKADALLPADRVYLDAQCAIVREGLRSTIMVARALSKIARYKDGALWRGTHGSFEAFCQEHFRLQKSQSYRLSQAGDFILALEAHSPRGENLPVNERQIRPVLQLPAEQRVAVWQELTQKTPAARLSNRVVAERVRAQVDASGLRGPAERMRGTRAKKVLFEQTLANIEELKRQFGRLGLGENLLDTVKRLKRQVIDSREDSYPPAEQPGD